MRLETILKAFEECIKASVSIDSGDTIYDWRREHIYLRQRDAFRAYILKMDKEKDDEIKRLTDLWEWY